MTRKNTHGDDAQHTPGVNDGLPSNPVAIARYEAKRAESRRLQREALELRKSGYSYRQIGEVQGCTASAASQRVNKAIKREVPQELIDSTRQVELDRLDAMTLMNTALMEKAFQAGDVEGYLKLQAANNAIHDRRKGIVPIQQPTKLVIDQQVTSNEQDRELSELIGKEADQMQAKLDSLNALNKKAFG